MCDNCSAALKNEQEWIDVAIATAETLEKVALGHPEDHPLRLEGLSAAAAVRATPFDAKRRKKALSSE